MPALLLPLLIASAPLPETVALRGATIREWGARPAFGSGVLWTVRKLVVTAASGEALTLYHTYFAGNEEPPPPGSRCDIAYQHQAGISALPGEGGVIREGDSVSEIRCDTPIPAK